MPDHTVNITLEDFVNAAQQIHNQRAEESHQLPEEVHFILPDSCQRMTALSILARSLLSLIEESCDLHDNMPVTARLLLESARDRIYPLNEAIKKAIVSLTDENIVRFEDMIDAYRKMLSTEEDEVK